MFLSSLIIRMKGMVSTIDSNKSFCNSGKTWPRPFSILLVLEPASNVEIRIYSVLANVTMLGIEYLSPRRLCLLEGLSRHRIRSTTKGGVKFSLKAEGSEKHRCSGYYQRADRDAI